MSQEVSLWPNYWWEVIDLFLKLRGPTADSRDELIERFDLTPPRIRHLFQGNRQKVALIAAFALMRSSISR